MAQVSLQHLILHRHNLVLKALAAAYMSVMKLQVQRVEMARDVTQKGQLCCVLPFAFQKLTYFLTQLETSVQYFSSA